MVTPSWPHQRKKAATMTGAGSSVQSFIQCLSDSDAVRQAVDPEGNGFDR
jgi:hypothetical protein